MEEEVLVVVAVVVAVAEERSRREAEEELETGCEANTSELDLHIWTATMAMRRWHRDGRGKID